MISQEGMIVRLLENGFEREDEEYLANRKYGYLVKVEEDDYIEVFSMETSGSIRIPFDEVELVEGTIKFPFDWMTYRVGNPYNFEAISPRSTPRILRKNLGEGLERIGFQNYGNSYVKDRIRVELNQFRLKITDGVVELFPSIRATAVGEPNLILVIANTLMIVG